MMHDPYDPWDHRTAHDAAAARLYEWYNNFMQKSQQAEITKVGPHGYIHGWIKVGTGSLAAHHSAKDSGSAFSRLGLKYDSSSGRVKDKHGTTIGHITAGQPSTVVKPDGSVTGGMPTPGSTTRSYWLRPGLATGSVKKEVHYGGDYQPEGSDTSFRVPDDSNYMGKTTKISEAKEAIARAHEAHLASSAGAKTA
jgi:hypothetical protein